MFPHGTWLQWIREKSLLQTGALAQMSALGIFLQRRIGIQSCYKQTYPEKWGRGLVLPPCHDSTQFCHGRSSVEGCPHHVQTLLSWLFFTCLISLEVFNWFKAHIKVAQRANRFSTEILWIVAQPFTIVGKRGTRRCKKEIFKVNYLLIYRLSATSAWQVW